MRRISSWYHLLGYAPDVPVSKLDTAILWLSATMVNSSLGSVDSLNTSPIPAAAAAHANSLRVTSCSSISFAPFVILGKQKPLTLAVSGYTRYDLGSLEWC